MTTERQTRDRNAGSFVPAPIKRALAARGATTGGVTAVDAQAAIVWCDLRKFTPLSARLVSGGPRGVEQLHRLLASHYQHLLDTLRRFGGEPMLYAGDGLLVAFGAEGEALAVSARRAVACAQAILAMPETIDDRGAPLGVNVFVAAGGFAASAVGTPSIRLSIAHGDAIIDLQTVASLASPGEVIVSAKVKAALPDLATRALAGGFVVETKVTSHADAPERPSDCAPELLTPYLSRPVIAGLESGELDWVAELRRVSIVFAQLPEFDHVSAGTTDRLQRLLEIVAPIAEAHEATLNEVVIDDKGLGILLYQGVPPLAHADDPARAVSLSLALHTALADAGIRARMGVATGTSYCGIIGTGLLSHYTVIGSQVNLAARLMMATSDGILVDAATVRAAQQEFYFEAHAPIALKGHEQPVPVWTPAGRATRTASGPSAFVGRTAELLALDAELLASREGKARAVILRGPAGMGKTVLSNTFLDASVAAGATVLRGAGIQVSRDAAYHAFRPVFEELLGAGSGTPAERRTRAEAALGPLADRAGLLNAVLPLGFADSAATAQLAGEQRATATRELLSSLLGRAASGVLILAIDDVQWLDAASLSLVQKILSDATSIFVLLGHRPETDAETLGVDALASRVLSLSSLALDDQRALVCRQLGATSVDDRLLAFLSGRSGGHPLYLAELSQAMRDGDRISVTDGRAAIADGVDLDTLSLPDTVQGLVVQRLDRLPQGPQLTLKVSSTVGPSFPTEVVASVHPIEAETPRVPGYLDHTSRLGILHPQLSDDREGYVFHHGLMRDIAYGLLPFQQRRSLHKAIAQWWEAREGGAPETQLLTLAHHWEQAEELSRAVDYLEREAVRAFSVGLASSSVALGVRAAALLGVVLPTRPEEIGPQIGANMGGAMQALAGRHPSALIDLPKLDDAKVERLLWLLPRVGPFTFQTRQLELFALMAVTGLRLTIQHGNGAPSADVYSMYSPVHRGMTGDRVGAHAWSQLALAVDEKHGRTMRARVAFVHTWFHQHWVSPLAESLPVALEAAEAGLASGDVLFGCFNLSGYVVYLAALGRPLDEVERVAGAHLERNGRRVINAAFHLVHERQVARAFAGKTRALLSLSDDEISEEADVASICATDFSNQIGYYLVSRVKLHAHAGDWATAVKIATDMQPLVPAFEGQVAEFELVQYHAIARLQLAAEAPEHLDVGRALVTTMRGFASLCAANFEHKALLLEAELARAEGRFDPTIYVRAAETAPRESFLQDAGLAYELLGRAQASQGNATQARDAFGKARDAYGRWGAHAKVALIDGLATG